MKLTDKIVEETRKKNGTEKPDGLNITLDANDGELSVTVEYNDGTSSGTFVEMLKGRIKSYVFNQAEKKISEDTNFTSALKDVVENDTFLQEDSFGEENDKTLVEKLDSDIEEGAKNSAQVMAEAFGARSKTVSSDHELTGSFFDMPRAVFVDASGGNVSVSLPSDSGDLPELMIHFLRVDSSSNTAKVDGETFSDKLILVYDGSSWTKV